MCISSCFFLLLAGKGFWKISFQVGMEPVYKVQKQGRYENMQEDGPTVFIPKEREREHYHTLIHWKHVPYIWKFLLLKPFTFFLNHENLMYKLVYGEQLVTISYQGQLSQNIIYQSSNSVCSLPFLERANAWSFLSKCPMTIPSFYTALAYRSVPFCGSLSHARISATTSSQISQSKW